MKSIGEIFKESRKAKNITVNDVARSTKIKTSFVQLIEEGGWNNLPNYSVLSGFIKNIASYLELDVAKSHAIFKRDYLPQKPYINPRKDVSKKFIWNPKFTFVLLSGLLFVVITGYLIFQYRKSTSPPELIVNSPTQGQVVKAGSVVVSGTVTSDATVTANNQPIIVNDGYFEGKVFVTMKTTQIEVVAKTRTGNKTSVTHMIEVN